LCNLACTSCYIESSPTNDALVYLSQSEVSGYLDEIERLELGTSEVGFTGGEPFMNREIIAMLTDSLSRGFEVLVLTNAMRPMRRFEEALLALREDHGERLTLRVSLDHYSKPVHEEERGLLSWDVAIDGLRWLSRHGFSIAVAGRHLANENEAFARLGYARLFQEEEIAIDADDSAKLVLFPEMDAALDVPEITTSCWATLNVDPKSVMCATSRMVVKHKTATQPVVTPCTLLPYGDDFQLGPTLAAADRPVALNHPHCARFCVLGGASCTA
jgi:uncharacterized Fe-S cluster-containing radical SAM superfamily protein